MSPDMEYSPDQEQPLLTAVASSARQLYLLLRCISFVSKVHVQIGKDGLRFTAEDSQVMQGAAFLDQSLFTSYTFSQPSNINQATQEEDFDIPPFQISLSSLLETLQIFGINDSSKDRWSKQDDGNSGYARNGTSAFESKVLGVEGVCKLTYPAIGDPLCIFLEESGVTTTCELVTYEADYFEEIPLQKDAIAQKIIMEASRLHDAINELSSTAPTRLTIVSAPTAPFFALSSSGPLGSATVEFSKDPQLLETFQVPRKTINIYKFASVRGASRAMEIATKVSIRTDDPGVLSLQFMIEVEGARYSFVDFRFVPFLPEEGDSEQEFEEERHEAVS